MERKARSYLEQMLVDETADPKALPLSLLEDITGGFSEGQEIGRGGFAVVYKGILGDRAVAVKRLSNAYMHEMEFLREVECLMRVKHKNVVRFLGYCADTQGNMERYNGKLVMADLQQRLLCFEYMPKGSLDKYISDAYREWGMCYKVIKGICEGLQYLHENHIIHLDLKPANILIDDNMVPKITDFGLSRCFDENQSRDITKTILGTMGYMAPELREGGIIARSADLYSLGVIIIEIITGQKGYQAIGDVLESWSDRLERSQRDTLCEQIRVCYETALECREFNPKKRPASAQKIIERLHEMESIQTGTAASSTTSRVTVTTSKEMSNTNDPRVCCFVPTTGRAISAAEGPLARGSPYGLVEMKPASLPTKADEALEKPWPSEAHFLYNERLTDDTRYNVYYSPKLMYLRVAVIGAQDLVPAEEGRPLVATFVKVQLRAQVRRTRTEQPQGSANLAMWKEEFMFVTSEPLEDPLVLTVEERISLRRDEAIGRIIIPVAPPSPIVARDSAKPVMPYWFSLSPIIKVDEAEAGSKRRESSKRFAGKIHLRMSLETKYHVLDESPLYASDLQPAAYHVLT